MNKIIKLSENLIKQIAAGEIISRPASAIKELIENAIDANATIIKIHINNCGIDKIIVNDNGHGMSKNDLEICTDLHTTSKTSENDKSFGQHSFGFRGEALASIAAISDLHIKSNAHQWYNGKISPITHQTGTKIEIKNMFHNVPVRLKFLKKSAIENDHIKQLIKKFAIHYPQIKWIVYFDNHLLWQFDNTTHLARINEIFNETPLYFEQTAHNITLSGYIFKKHTKFNALYVNNRIVQDKAIFTYINGIFKEYFMKNEESSYILSVKIDPLFIDCNVHPAKLEIKFISYEEIYAVLLTIFSPELFKKLHTQDNAVDMYPVKLAKSQTRKTDKKLNITNVTKYYNEEVQYVNEPMIFHSKNTEPDFFHIIGQIKQSYIIFETANRIGIFDQHAAHERLLYQKMKKELNEESAQQLLLPVELELDAEQYSYIQNNLAEFRNKGIIIRNQQVTHVPTLLNALNIKTFLEAELTPNMPCGILIDRLLADIACKKALKANSKLSMQQMQKLLDDSLPNPPVCNHGRPVFKYFTQSEINAWFER